MEKCSSDKMVVIETEDELKFTIPETIAKMSKTLFNVLENTTEDESIPIAIHSDVYKLIVDWCVYHHENPDKPLAKLPVHKKHPMVLPDFDMKILI